MYDCVKPSLASRCITFGRVNASARKITSGCSRLHAVDHPFPERERLGVRVVDAEDAHALADPELEDAGELLPERRPLRRLEVERIDVLVFLGRVLRVLHRAVGAPAEPLRMLAHVRMVGRALERDVERELEPELAGAGDEPPEILERAELRVQRLVAAFGGADGPRAADVLGRRPRACCCGPCAARGRSGGSAAGRARRSPSSRRTRAAPRNRAACRARRARSPHERGNISYHAPNRARTRSTTSGNSVGCVVARLRSGWRIATAASSSSIASARSAGSAAAARRRCAHAARRWRSSPVARAAGGRRSARRRPAPRRGCPRDPRGARNRAATTGNGRPTPSPCSDSGRAR